MGDGTGDEIKGRMKEAGGDLTGDKDLKNEGKVDRASGTVKDKVGDVGDKAKDAIRKD
ncbi:MAG: CsbD family protein [Solirubrobacterales bacterium]|nr:CsbD family protein [Solirubrobacterales bacterium]